MSHRIHTILSLLAEDPALAGLRPSLILAIDWPTVAEEAPETWQDAHAADLVAQRLSSGKSDSHPAIAPLAARLAARLATVAASLAATGDKAMADHAAALWGAAAALVGLPATAGFDRADEAGGDGLPQVLVGMWRDMTQRYGAALLGLGWDGAEDLKIWTERRQYDFHVTPIAGPLRDILGVRACGAADLIENVRAMKAAHDKALADIDALRSILGVPEGGNLVDHAGAFVVRYTAIKDRDDAIAEAAKPRLHCDEYHAHSAERGCFINEDQQPTPRKPQPGDAVPWTEVEDGSLYADDGKDVGASFLAHHDGRWYWLFDEEDGDLLLLLNGRGCDGPVQYMHAQHAILVARDLGIDPDAWRAAMREWTANGNKPPAAR